MFWTNSHLRISWQSCSCILSLVSAHMWRRGTPLWSRSSCARCTWFGHFIIHGHFLSYELFLDTRDTMWSTRFWNLNQISVFSQSQVSMVTTLGLGWSVQFSQTISLIKQLYFKQYQKWCQRKTIFLLLAIDVLPVGSLCHPHLFTNFLGRKTILTT